MHPSGGQEFIFFPESIKCPVCGTPKFWNLNDSNVPRNQELINDCEDENEEESTVLGEYTGVKDQNFAIRNIHIIKTRELVKLYATTQRLIPH